MKQTFNIGFFACFLCICSDHSVMTTGHVYAPGNDINPYELIDQGQALLKEGDLVVRLNRDPFSCFIKMFNKHDKSFSHSGIVLYENGYPYVFHVVTGDENPTGKLRKDSLARFCDPRKNNAFGIYRYAMNASEIEQLKTIIHHWYEARLGFDSNFNLRSDDRMYCSEMVGKAIARATNERIQINPTPLNSIEAGLFSAYTHLPITYTLQLAIISIDDLYTNPFCRPVRQFNYIYSGGTHSK